MMLGFNCIRLGVTYLWPWGRPKAWPRATLGLGLVVPRMLGISLVLLGLLFIYAVCAPFPELPGHQFFKKIYLL